MYVHAYVLGHIPDFGHSKHCPGEANDTPDNSKQHCSKDNELSLTDSPPQLVVLKQTGAAKYITHTRITVNNKGGLIS